MASEVGIGNSALQKIGASERITSLTEDSRNARAINSCYTEMRDAELEAHPWNCARRRVKLTADTDLEIFDGDYQYTLPPDCLRVILSRGIYLDWRIEGGKIISSEAGPLEVEFVRRVTDPNEMPASLREVIACRIAVQICEAITQSNTKLEAVAAMRREALAEARRMNAMQNVPTVMDEDEWIDARL